MSVASKTEHQAQTVQRVLKKCLTRIPEVLYPHWALLHAQPRIKTPPTTQLHPQSESTSRKATRPGSCCVFQPRCVWMFDPFNKSTCDITLQPAGVQVQWRLSSVPVAALVLGVGEQRQVWTPGTWHDPMRQGDESPRPWASPST